MLSNVLFHDIYKFSAKKFSAKQFKYHNLSQSDTIMHDLKSRRDDDIVLIDESDEKRDLNIFLKGVSNKLMLIRLHQFLMGCFDNFFKHGPDLFKKVKLNCVITDIIKSSLKATAEEFRNRFEFKEARLFFNDKKLHSVFFQNYSNEIRQRNQNGTLRSLLDIGKRVSGDRIVTHIIIPLKLNLYTYDNRVIDLFFDLSVNTTFMVELLRKQKDYIINVDPSIDLTKLYEYKALYDCGCKFSIIKKNVNQELVNLCGTNLLYANFVNCIKTCLLNEVGFFLFQEIYTSFIESEKLYDVLKKLRNTNNNSYHKVTTLIADHFRVKNQKPTYINSSFSFNPNTVNLLHCVMGKLYTKYIDFNLAITFNNDKLMKHFNNCAEKNSENEENMNVTEPLFDYRPYLPPVRTVSIPPVPIGHGQFIPTSDITKLQYPYDNIIPIQQGFPRRNTFGKGLIDDDEQ